MLELCDCKSEGKEGHRENISSSTGTCVDCLGWQGSAKRFGLPAQGSSLVAESAMKFQ